MLFAFIDESYTQDRYYVAAVLIDADDIGAIGAAINNSAEYALGFGVPLGTEFHAHSIMSGTDGWEPIGKKSRAKVAVFRHFVNNIAGLPAKAYIEGVDIPRLNARYRYPESPHLITLRHVLEDVHAAAMMRGETIVVICDEVTDQESHRKRFGQYQLIGTPGYRSTKLSTIEQFMFADSSASPGLQAADAIAYLYRRLDAHTEKHQQTRDAVEAAWAALRPIRAKVRRWDP